MRLCERRCEACGELADGEPSAHFARVVWFCSRHSAEFHDPAVVRLLASAPSTLECWAAIDCWLRVACALQLASTRLRLVPVDEFTRPPANDVVAR